jgi:hypothetical protein
MIKRTMARLLGAMVVACGLAGPALADPPPTTVSSILDVAWNIRAQFAARYLNGKVGNDWCFNVDTERGYSWWYYNTGSGLVAQKIRNTVRIQAIYDINNVADSPKAYSSVFLGILTDDSSAIDSTREFDLNYTFAQRPGAPARPATAPARTPAPEKRPAVAGPPAGYEHVPVLGVPDGSSGSRCMSFDMFLNSYMLPNTALDVVSSNEPVVLDVESTQGSYANARWWMFNGRGHQVFNIATYALKVFPQGTGPAVPFTLVVGFGGGAGP